MKLTVSVSDQTNTDLRSMAERRQTTMTDVLRRAVALQKFFDDHPDAEIVITEGTKVTRVVIFP